MNEKETRLNYVGNQMIKVCPFPVFGGENGQIKLKLHSECGDSNWLNITPEQFKLIERVLLEEIGPGMINDLLFSKDIG